MHFLALLLLTVSDILAADLYHNCYATLEEQQADVAEMKANCLAYGGGGSSFHYEAPSAPVTCKLRIDSKTVVFEKYYGALFDCNTCNSKEMLQEMAIFEGICNGQCRKNGVVCQHDYFTWGSYFNKVGTIYGNYMCGDIDRSLPGCAVSSSSEIVESSSSEVVESSSSEYEEDESSSSYAISSSSEEDVESSSSEEEIDSSSSEDDDYSASSVGDIIPCYKPNLDGKCSVFTYVSRSPMPMVGTLKFKPSDLDDGFFAYYSDGEGYLSFNSNVPVQKKGNFYYDCYYDSNNCGQGDDLPPMIEGDVYYCVWGEPTSMGCATPSFSVPISITENLKYRRTDVSPPNITDEHVLKIANEAARTYSDVMIFCILNGVERTFGTFELPKKENRTIEDVFDFIRPRLDYCRSRDRSSSSQISSSSSSAKSSSSNVKSSSSSKTIEISSSSIEDKSSSSVNNERSSSSKFVESSSSKHMSSSSEGNVFVAGADQEYTPGKIYSSGLHNMEPGKCYSLNPERGTQYGWICTNAQDKWWWHEVPCDGSAPAKKVTSAGCIENKRGSNAVYRPEDCFYSGLDNMEPGKCYSLNPERGTQRGWISSNAQDSWWWIETPCEKNGKGLYKRVSGHVGGESDAVLESSQTTRAYYNVLGRKMGRNKAFGVKQPVYSKKIRK